MPTTSPNGNTSTPQLNISISQLFQKLGLPLWWLPQNVTQFWGQNGEQGTDFGLGGFGKPIGSLTGGTVVYVGNGGYPGSSIGQIVQVLAPNGLLLHYQHLMTSQVTVGQQITPGTVIGTGGGCPVGAYPSPLVGNSCTSYDNFSTGQHIEVRVATSYNPSAGVWNQNWVNPLSVFQQLAQDSTGGTLPVNTSGNSNSGSNTGNTGGSSNSVCDIPVAGGIICGLLNTLIPLFERVSIVLIGLTIVLIALILFFKGNGGGVVINEVQENPGAAGA